ncbi:MAG: gluconate 2-dehydrogenase subunit 3 family protein [Acidobacteriaceae bacterium]|nr:gluconate 2-dehydrogenase subunit 3 family protein [Acidobacteriaceae bacterium]MBV9781025.1 gluconate 2-dehydrogenase subunit 3 family protein [Acidobacteriaceae bacterium]
MNRRELFRSTVLGSLGATLSTVAVPAAGREFPFGYDASKELERPDWKPVFLDEHQNATLIALSDLLIPATGTPGAKEALVNRFLDLLMSAEQAETQRAFIAALAYIDGECMRRYNSAFVYVAREQQLEFLTLLAYPHSLETWGEELASFSGHDHFMKLKSWIAGAYYSSPAGLKELGWDGTFPHGVFTGCEHGPDEHGGETSK